MAQLLGFMLPPDSPEDTPLHMADIAPLPGLESRVHRHGDLVLRLAHAPLAPIDWADTPGRGAFVLGEALRPGGAKRLSARELLGCWKTESDLESWDGYHLLSTVDADTGVVHVGCDRMGNFPLYYLDLPGAVAFSTSPALLRSHPRYRDRLDMEGLCGVLLTRSGWNGRTLRGGIRRLEPGNVLRLSLHDSPRELPQWRPGVHPDAGSWASRSFDEHLEIFHEAHRQAARRHFANGAPIFQLLSGGLDSRMVCGLLRDEGLAPPAVSLGRFVDTETRVARTVARHMGRPFLRVPDRLDRMAEMGRWVLRWEDLASGFYFFLTPLMDRPDTFRRLGERIATGFQMDYVSGGADLDPERIPRTADEFLDGIWHRLGWTPGGLGKLLRPEHRWAVDSVVEAARDRWRAGDPDPVRNAWIQGLSLEDRHTVGINLWKSSFCRWPVVCTLDEEVLRTCLSLPLSSSAGRRLQRELVKRRWPDLAALPLDRNSFHASSLDADRAAGLDLWLGRFRQGLRKFLGIETRYFHTLFEMGTPQWREVREAMEPGRVPAGRVFQPRALLDALPPPATPFPAFSNGLADTVRIKTLLGAMGWFGENADIPLE